MSFATETGAALDTFLVREHIGLMKLHEEYDILAPDGKKIGTAIERAGTLKKLLKLVVNKNMLPFTVEIVNPQGQIMVTIHRPFTIFRSRVSVANAAGEPIGHFRQRMLSLGGAFDVYDRNEQLIANLQGDWKGWNFKFLDKNGQELGVVSRKWTGLAQELFTSADNYVVHIDREKIPDVDQLQLLLAAAICIDMVLKEKG
jgi:uncharacterized protein YxjI